MKKNSLYQSSNDDSKVENAKKSSGPIQKSKKSDHVLYKKFTDNKDEFFKYMDNRGYLENALIRGGILQRGDYILRKLGGSKDNGVESELKHPNDYKPILAEVVALDFEYDIVGLDMYDAPDISFKSKEKFFVKDFDSVLLDAGSTNEMIAQQLFRYRQYLTILTNNMGVWASFCGTNAKTLDELFDELRRAEEQSKNFSSTSQTPNMGQKTSEIQSKNELVLTGGWYAPMYDALLGNQAIKAFDSFSPSVVIIGTSGIVADEGLFCHGGEESNVKEKLWLTKTSKRIIATTSDKIGKRDSHMFGDIQKSRAYLDEGGDTILITDRARKDDSVYKREYKKLKEYLHIIEVDCIKGDDLETDKSKSRNSGNQNQAFSKENINPDKFYARLYSSRLNDRMQYIKRIESNIIQEKK